VARKRNPFDLSILAAVEEDLRLPSLLHDPPRVEGYAYRFKIILPLLSAMGEPVYTEEHLLHLLELFNDRCGGSLASSGLTHPAWYGSYRPAPGAATVKDYHCVIYVYTRPTEAADRFYQLLKALLKKGGLQEQDEILMERAPLWLVEAAPLPRGR
jgi:hypothetical protein